MISLLKEWFGAEKVTKFANGDLIKIEDFLSKGDLDAVLNVLDAESKVSSTDLDLSNSALEIVRRAAERKVEGIKNCVFHYARLKYGGVKSTLHHDLNQAGRRKFSLILYLKQPDSGGETVFPFFDREGNPVSNEITAKCSELQEVDDENPYPVWYLSTRLNYEAPNIELENMMRDNKEDYLYFKPTQNTAVIQNLENTDLWHFALPEEGERLVMALFWEAPK